MNIHLSLFCIPTFFCFSCAATILESLIARSGRESTYRSLTSVFHEAWPTLVENVIHSVLHIYGESAHAGCMWRALGNTACVCLQFAAPQLTPAVKNAKNSNQGKSCSIKSIKESEEGRGNGWHDGCMSSGQRALKGKWAVVLESTSSFFQPFNKPA